ncbi:MAG: Zn-dependent hydrolase [Maricaulaceae bacterium]
MRVSPFLGLLALTLAAPALAQTPTVNAERIAERIETLSQYGANAEGGVDRVAYSEADLAGRAYLKDLMAEAGLSVRVTPGGNIIGTRPGARPDAPAIMVGSHSDSVPGGGNYDGPAGVLTALEVAQTLEDGGITLDHPLEVIIFANEEGGLVGSRALTGRLSQDALAAASTLGISHREGIAKLGGDPDKIIEGEPHYAPGALRAFIELHIEQGRVLEGADQDIGVVQGIVGIRWWDVTLSGTANHAGTTPMNRREDPLLAAAQLIQAVNRAALDRVGAQVATVGKIEAFPGAPNVIPARVEMSLEIRDLSTDVMQAVFDDIQAQAAAITAHSGVEIAFEEIPLDIAPAPTDDTVRAAIAQAAEDAGLSYRFMPSGAGHDAQQMTHIAPTGMIFVPSKDGISHSPKEFTANEDLANGAQVMLGAVLALDKIVD